jgi:FAD:protein FMN transferase
MGTWVDVSYIPVESQPDLNSEIESALRAFERDYYAWAPGQLATLNRQLNAGETATVTPELAGLLGRAQEISALSGGSFDPAVGALVELWGFHTSIDAPAAPPSDEQVSSRLASLGSIATLRINGSQIQADSSEMTLDLGGIAKGFAVDILIELLSARGVEHALVNAGGDLRALGQAGGTNESRAWRVGVQHPRDTGLIGIIELKSGESAFTSGDYERYYEFEGERLHHIIDPQSGYPVSHTQAVTVIAEDGVTADAAATALFVAGPDKWAEVARRLGINSVIRVAADGAVQLSDAMSERLEGASGSESDIMLPPDEDLTD